MSDYTHGEYVVSAGQGRYYTPTTEEVRRRYMFGCWQEYQDTSGDYKAEIDRWLAEVKAQERKAERERIKQRLWDDGYLYEMERDYVWLLIGGEGSDNSSSQPTAETHTYLTRQGEEQ